MDQVYAKKALSTTIGPSQRPLFGGVAAATVVLLVCNDICIQESRFAVAQLEPGLLSDNN